VTRTSERESFVRRLVREIASYRDSKYTGETVDTIYFGGGTPSLLEPVQVERIINELDRTFHLDIQELTFEVNPDDVTAEFLSALKGLGVTRLSMGVQSFQPDLLEFMHRAHSREEAIRCLELLSQSDFESYTIDLIYGNPEQSIKDLDKDLDLLLGFDPPHVSAYSLTIEPGTRLGKQVELGRIAPPEDDKIADHFDLVNERLRAKGILRYEVSNYSKPGREAVHNSNYWEHENYLGFGPAAHSFWWDQKAVRWEQERSLRDYLKGEDISSKPEALTSKQLSEERLMMGLRTRHGVSVKELKERYDYQLSKNQKAYLRERENEQKLRYDERIRLTDKGVKIADAILLDLVTLH
jgi:oxygen-independent coproporphyrinogen-3 oxidase